MQITEAIVVWGHFVDETRFNVDSVGGFATSDPWSLNLRRILCGCQRVPRHLVGTYPSSLVRPGVASVQTMSAARPLGAYTDQRHQPEHTVLSWLMAS